MIGGMPVDGKGNVTAYFGYLKADPVASSERDFGQCQMNATLDDNGEVIDYSRNSWNDGGGFNGGNNNGNGVPVSWAVGSFYAPSPQGGTIYLTVANNGQVTVEMGNGPIYGTLYGTVLSINGAVANVSRAGNGIRTTRPDNGESITYRRQ